MLNDISVIRAISQVLNRAERSDPAQLRQSFVDPGIMLLLESDNSQILFGRRGTGKTHVLASLSASFTTPGHFVVSVDFRTLGSTAQFTDANAELNGRCLSLYQDILASIHEQMLKAVFSSDGDTIDINAAVTALDNLVSIIAEPVTRERTQAQSIEQHSKRDDGTQLDLAASAKGLSAKASFSDKSSADLRTTTSSTFFSEDKIIFYQVFRAMGELLTATKGALYLLFDEWSSLPIDLQPYLAEFLKRSFIPHKDITLKIAAIENRSNFSEREEAYITGFELGSDVAAALSLDDYYVYEKKPRDVCRVCADILYRHLMTTGEEHLTAVYNVRSPDDLIGGMFADENSFRELVRSSEGVVRDLINVFCKAAVAVYSSGRVKIDTVDVLGSARQWYEQNKVSELREDLRSQLQMIVADVIGKGSRYFLVPATGKREPVIDGLFDARVVHLVQKNFFDALTPGKSFNAYSIDYGACASLYPEEFREINSTVRKKKTRDTVDLFGRGERTKRVIWSRPKTPDDSNTSIQEIPYGKIVTADLRAAIPKLELTASMPLKLRHSPLRKSKKSK